MCVAERERCLSVCGFMQVKCRASFCLDSVYLSWFFYKYFLSVDLTALCQVRLYGQSSTLRSPAAKCSTSSRSLEFTSAEPNSNEVEDYIRICGMCSDTDAAVRWTIREDVKYDVLIMTYECSVENGTIVHSLVGKILNSHVFSTKLMCSFITIATHAGK